MASRDGGIEPARDATWTPEGDSGPLYAQVPEMRDALLDRGDWKKIGETQLATVFADTPENMERHKQKMNNLMQAFDFMGMMQGVRS